MSQQKDSETQNEGFLPVKLVKMFKKKSRNQPSSQPNQSGGMGDMKGMMKSGMSAFCCMIMMYYMMQTFNSITTVLG